MAAAAAAAAGAPSAPGLADDARGTWFSGVEVSAPSVGSGVGKYLKAAMAAEASEATTTATGEPAAAAAAAKKQKKKKRAANQGDGSSQAKRSKAFGDFSGW